MWISAHLEKKDNFLYLATRQILNTPTDSTSGQYLAWVQLLSERCACLVPVIEETYWKSQEELQELKNWKTHFTSEI